jgi:putative transposase
MSPRTAMLRSLKQCGARQHKYIPYSYTFQVLTMPTTRSGRAKVHPQKGVRVNYLDYWSDAFLDPEIEGKEVDVRFDPDDVSVAHVYVHGQWEPCISSHAVVFKGWSYRAIKLASEELRATRKGAAKKRAITSRQLADFMSKVSDHESMRMLQLRESAAIPIPDQSNGSETETEETSTPAPEEDSQETSTPDQEDCFPTSNE